MIKQNEILKVNKGVEMVEFSVYDSLGSLPSQDIAEYLMSINAHEDAEYFINNVKECQCKETLSNE